MRWIARHLRSTLLMLLMAAFVVVPVADVLACAVEPHDTVAAHVEAAADDADGDSDGTHTGACSHNHCHHSNLSLPAGTVAAFGTPLPARWMPAGDSAAYAVAQDELKRPPRA
ncbi:hypothetical protein C1929_20780 [Stenotrophomonas sp. ZAC14D1_NAIMI4_6]|jgi:hypothetical protein|uniref:hypothetical protein n=1 Tax=Stenotrophomonas TaxID=40323 RepID=UPI000D53F4A1|nr:MULTISPECIES: hypothetical protein [Stenotrophomonas]AWH39044.1 hypothetical protein C1929_20780 [Stenotrophomonas sp. ZAC14D1_NAIMI4_6]AWH43175.1 hypothetical protein C1927_20780 [Stenotrophomonas sp. ZAC14D1_NAIMI4_1]